MVLRNKLQKNFSLILLKWNGKKNVRKMPWKGEKDPYKIWLSEIILQQTRVEQGLAYYQKFVELFPTIKDLALSSNEKIYKLWEGLGYYNRCKNLIETAHYVSKNLNGIFPDTYEEIIALKGIGSYTASAIASFAYNLPYAVVDGNVFRVLSRVFGIKKAIDSSEGKKYFSKLASELLDKKRPGVYNQALMDFGAVVCKPINPICSQCVFKMNCKAFQDNRIKKLPVKEKRIIIKRRWLYYLIIEYRGRIYIKQRTDKDIWKNLFEFFLVEVKSSTDIDSVLNQAVKSGIIKEKLFTIQTISKIQSQLLSHQKISGQFIKIKLSQKIEIPGYILVSPTQLNNYAFPKFIKSYLDNDFS